MFQNDTAFYLTIFFYNDSGMSRFDDNHFFGAEVLAGEIVGQPDITDNKVVVCVPPSVNDCRMDPPTYLLLMAGEALKQTN